MSLKKRVAALEAQVEFLYVARKGKPHETAGPHIDDCAEWPSVAEKDLDPPVMNARLEGEADSPAFVRCEQALFRALADSQIGQHHHCQVGQFRAKHED